MNHSPSKPGVYFLELELENVRCFGPKVTIDLRDPKDPSKPARWTVLVGENGVGKTTVLRSLVSVAPFPNLSNGGGVNSIKYWPSYPDFSEYWTAARDANPDIEYWATARDAEDALIRVKIANAIEESSSSEVRSIEYKVIVNPYARYTRFPTGKENPSGFENSSFAVLGYGASRHMGTKAIEDKPLQNASLSLFLENVELINASDLFHQSYITSQREGDTRLHETVRAIILNVLPDISDIKPIKVDTLTWRTQVETPYGWVWIHDLSLGYKTMVAWIVDFASKLFLLYPNSPNPLAEPAVCLVDEIDLHMHPTWQRDIMGFLTRTFPNTQFIVTAHSPLMVQAAAEANVILLKREGDHVVVNNEPEIVKNWSVDQILASVFGVSGRPEATEKNMERRRELLAKSARTPDEQQELERLEEDLTGYSYLESPEEIKAASLIREFAGMIKRQKQSASDDQNP